MKTLIALTTLIAGTTASAMPNDSGWICKSASGKYEVEVQRSRYTNSIQGLVSLKIDGHGISQAQLTSAYDSKSLGGRILALEVSVPDSKNDLHFVSFELVGNKGIATERVVEMAPAPQKTIAAEAITCEEAE
jgi:hypothetical protein